MKKRILLIGYCNKFFRREYAKNIRDDDLIIDILSFEKCEPQFRELYDNVYVCENNFKGKLRVIFLYVQFLFSLLKLQHYDAIHIHSVKKIESFFASLIKKKSNRLICSLYGSDFYRISDADRKSLNRLFKKADYITIAAERMIEDFNNYYAGRYNEKIRNITFGLAPLEVISNLKQKNPGESLKGQFGIPEGSFVITVGYNATKEQNHYKILEQIRLIKEKLPENYFVVIPLGYGDEKYKERLIHDFANMQLKGICLEKFYPVDKIAELRMVSDVMIQLQDTDMLSGSMLEYMYAENIIITGAWLSYRELRDFIVQIENIDELGSTLEEITNKFIQYRRTLCSDECSKFIEEKFIWKNVKKEWKALYN